MRVLLIFLILTFMPHMATAHEDLCASFIAHQPSDDVTYDPSAAEVPADLNAIHNTIKPEIFIPIDINLAERYGINIPNAEDLDSNVAIVKVNQSGEVFYNGQNITASVQDGCETNVQILQGANIENNIGQVTNDVITSESNEQSAPAEEDAVLEGGAY